MYKDKCVDRATYETARRETTKFVFAVLADNSVQEIRDADSIYIEVSLKDLFPHLQVGCTGRNALELLALHNEMQRYHLEVEGIPKYINMIEDARRQAGRAGRTITNKTLLLFASTAILTTERFPCLNEDWKERAERDNTWAQCKAA